MNRVSLDNDQASIAKLLCSDFVISELKKRFGADFIYNDNVTFQMISNFIESNDYLYNIFLLHNKLSV